MSFDYSLYDNEIETAAPKKVKEVPKKSGGFDYSLYDDESSSKAPVEEDEVYKQYKAREYTPELAEKLKNSKDGFLSGERLKYAEELNTEREYLRSAGFTKELASDLSFGFSERADALKPKEYETGQALGGLVGEGIKYGLGFKVLEKGIGLIPEGYKWGKRAARTLGAADLFATNEALTQIGKEEEFDPGKIGVAAVTGAAGDVAIRSLIKYVPKVASWVKSLTKSQQEDVLVNNAIPKNLSERDLKFYQDEVVPQQQALGEEQYKAAYESALAENEQIFQQKMNNLKAEHSNDITKAKQAESEYLEGKKEIEEANAIVQEEYEAAKIQWEETKQRETVVNDAIKSANQKYEGDRKLTAIAEPDAPLYRPAQTQDIDQGLKENIGKVISKEKTPNPTVGGEETVGAVRASAKADQKQVAQKYKISEDLNAGVNDTHPEAGNELRNLVEHLENKGNLSPEEQQMLSSAKTTLDNMIEFDSLGKAVGWKPVNNQFLLDQAKALRNKMYYEYSESNATGIFNPLLNLYEDAARRAAIATGNEVAALANDAARASHREWAGLYKNKYINQYRNLSVNKPTQLYDSALSIDNYRQLDRVLSRTNSGQNLSSKIKRDLVNKKLEKFYNDPKKVPLDKFEDELNKLSPILSDGEKSQIVSEFKQMRKTNYIPAKKVEPISEPVAPELKESPVKEFGPTKVKLPQKKEVSTTPEMRKAEKLKNITPEKSKKLTDSASGLKELKATVSKKTYEEATQRKVREIFHQGKVKQSYSGTQLFDIVNKGNNYEILSEILGESEVKSLLEAAEKIGKTNMTRESLLKISKNVSLVKAAALLGIL